MAWLPKTIATTASVLSSSIPSRNSNLPTANSPTQKPKKHIPRTAPAAVILPIAQEFGDPEGLTLSVLNDIAAAFLPDVLRIDTSIASPVGTVAYSNAAVPVGALGVVRPIAGRKLEDDVIDITLSVLTNGGITTDNVSYAGVPGNAAQPGHKKLLGQAAAGGTATFPYLADPN